MSPEIFESFWQNLTEISPSIFWAGLVLLAGILVSHWLGTVATAFLNKIRLNQALKRVGLEEVLLKIDVRLNAPKFLGEIVKWFFIVIVLTLALEILGLTQFSQFLEKVIGYFPNIFVSALIFVVAAFLTDFSQKVVVGTLEEERITYSKLFGRLIRWTIWLFAILAILYQLKIAPTLILTIFIGMVITISITLGIAFGLGGKDLAAKILKELEEKFK
jgi:small-conductance mechanosensitive channel